MAHAYRDPSLKTVMIKEKCMVENLKTTGKLELRGLMSQKTL